ncbi:hypothetical protein [Dokdonella sp.]|uniref:hypothetical protein n=1 Tax=Dokdonella sp. TaxID=2291710 RepID=UPI0027BB2177|nr:hypothetical protein [Dokdonella sp.]
MQITKSSRHSKITGDFAERLILYWLSKYGFECAFVDHVGLDLIARNPQTKEVMGISVKSRSRSAGTEGTSINIPVEQLGKLDSACAAFDCVPYFAIVADQENQIDAFILAKSHLIAICSVGKSVIDFKMRKPHIASYLQDPEIRSFSFQTRTNNWWQSAQS